MRKLLIICSAVLQVLLLAFMGGQREYILHTGRTVYLRTVPYDPRDYFRGDYVRLNYEISTLGKEYYGLVGITDYDSCKGRIVYTVLKVDDSKRARLEYVTDVKPSNDKLFIRGRIQYCTPSSIVVLYGIEAFFVEQGQGKELEDMVRNSQNIPFEMKVAIGSDGIAVLKGYRQAANNKK